MKRLQFFFSLFVLFSLGASAQKITTLSPSVEEQSQRDVNITKVELTSDYTIISFVYDYARTTRRLEDLIFGKGSNDQFIEVDPNCRLYEPRNASRKFRFVKAEGIPIAPQTRTVYPGDVVKFKVYFERLTPGIEVFDLYEGQDAGTKRFWNYYGVQIRNPKRVNRPKPPIEEKKEEGGELPCHPPSIPGFHRKSIS